MEPLLVFPDPPSEWLVGALARAAYPWVAVGDATFARHKEPEEGYSGAVISAVEDPEAAFALCRALRKREASLQPLLLVVTPARLGELELREDLFDDFVLPDASEDEVEARLAHLFWRT